MHLPPPLPGTDGCWATHHPTGTHVVILYTSLTLRRLALLDVLFHVCALRPSYIY